MPGLVLFEEGDPADALYFVSAGQVSVDILVGHPRRRARISTVPAGQAFGDGPHRCPGAHVALQETEIFLTKLFALPNLRLVGSPTVRFRPQINSYELVGTLCAADCLEVLPDGTVRLGFRREGYSPRYLKIRGRWRDHERWALLADE